MAQITASLVKDLREKTGAGMMDCKKALQECDGDFESAVDWLRKKGHALAGKKSGRVAAEGLVAVAVDGSKGVAVELNAETDFVARNENFQELVSNVVHTAMEVENVEELSEKKCMNASKSVKEEIVDAIAVIGENMNLRRMSSLEVSSGIVASYVHNSVKENVGKIAVLVAIESDKVTPDLEQLGKQIAMHVAAAKPVALTSSEVDSSLVEREKAIFFEQAKASGKPDNIVEKMVEGRVNKFYKEVVLLEQLFVIDGKTPVKDVVNSFAKEHNTEVEIKGFIRYEVGEGIEVETQDFAQEVAEISGTK
ncbi:MAG: translation elongation factor Ts [Rickettsiales bacterium]